jgi:deoxyribose-phosphate aldolase
MIALEHIARSIDHAVLSPVATRADLRAGCEIAGRFSVAALCVRPCDTAEAATILRGTGVAVATVVGFPHGASVVEAKRREIEIATADGATEIDYVVCLPRVADRDWAAIGDEARRVVAAARDGGALVKAIMEAAPIDADTLRDLGRALVDAGVDYLKTSTGFGPGSATLEQIAVMREAAAGRARLKASGGIRTREQAEAFINAGCDRLGTSATITILGQST